MSNERIDLTKFEEMEGWRIDEGNDVYHIVKENGESVISTWSENRNEDDSLELALKLASLPKLIAELKRCYEEIDSLQGKIDKANYAMQRYCDEWPDLPYPDHRIDNVCDAYEEVCLALE